MARADTQLVARRSRRTRPLPIRVLLIAALVILSMGLLRPIRRYANAPAPVSSPLTTVRLEDEGGARWTEYTDARIHHIRLNEGTLGLRVRNAAGGNRVVVHVPDGEIEDVGTTFHVVVARGHAERVTVDEGEVRLRLADIPLLTLSAGQTWERHETDQPPTVLTMPKVDASPVRASKHAIVPTPVRNHATGARPKAELGGQDEDAAYLNAIRLFRDGRTAEAKSAADDYVRRFPAGFRREEMDRMASVLSL